MVYLLTFIPEKSAFHARKWTSPMDPMGIEHFFQTCWQLFY